MRTQIKKFQQLVRSSSEVETLEKEREQYLAAIHKLGRAFPEIKLLKTIPGIGDIQAAKILSHNYIQTYSSEAREAGVC